MKSTITSKFQTTIPKVIREGLKLSVNDTLEWELKDGKVIVRPGQTRFLDRRSSIRVGPGDIEEDISASKNAIAEEYR